MGSLPVREGNRVADCFEDDSNVTLDIREGTEFASDEAAMDEREPRVEIDVV